jgi:hypothetical protein
MSRQSKNARKIVARKHFTALHKRGEKGPSGTKAVHGKKNTFRKASKAIVAKAGTIEDLVNVLAAA